MTKADIIEAVYDKVGEITKKKSSEAVEAVFSTMKEGLARGQTLRVSGFGNFVLHDKHERVGRNPQTGETLMITPRRVLKFRPSDTLRENLNGKN